MIKEQYVWLIWSSAYLVPWIIIFVSFPLQRKVMWWASLFGIYWSGVYKNFTWARLSHQNSTNAHYVK